LDTREPALDDRSVNSQRARLAVVSGANRGIGRELVRQLVRRGYHTVLGSRNLEQGQRAAEELAHEGATGVLVRQLDVTDQASIDRLAGELTEDFGRLDVLINNAGIHYDSWQRASGADLAIVREALETNLLGTWRMCLALLPLLRANGTGRIVNLSSEAASLTTMGGCLPAYRVSKVAVNALTRMLAAELRSDGVLVNAVSPGWVATDMGGPGGRPAADVATAVVWAAELPADGASGEFFRDERVLPW
jgi:NAD(P)-dependent dehydrogenase (short-subunit alcohol dehydrogenase family)